MATWLRFFEVASLGVWVGAAFFVGVLLAPGAFALLPTRELAGSVVGMALVRLHWLACACGLIYIFARLAMSRSGEVLWKGAPILVVVMLILTLASHHIITPRLQGLRAQMAAEHGSIDATPKDNPLRQQFGALHGVSSVAALLGLLLGTTALFLTIRNQP